MQSMNSLTLGRFNTGLVQQPRPILPSTFQQTPPLIHNSRSEITTNMPSLLSLPFELRQYIIFLALKDAAFKDIQFSNFQSCFTWNLRHFEARVRSESYRAVVEMICAPNVHDIAVKLASIDPQLQSDLDYPLRLILSSFENLRKDESGSRDLLHCSIVRRECLEARYNMVHDWESYDQRKRQGLWCQHMTVEERRLWWERIYLARRF
ncbi:hypothetical protein Vi05172_g1503 [Venturia inaequalis]|nr:hypothetical protein Vi05172_g1503 [Venturia inaequalis]